MSFHRAPAVVLALVLASTLLLPGMAQAEEPSPEELAAVHRLLGSIDGSVSAASFEAAARDPVAALCALAGNPKIDLQRRRSAVAALTNWPEERVWERYQELLAQALEPRLHAQLLMSTAAAFGARSLDTLATFLERDEVELRRAAVQAARLVGVDAKALLASQAERELDATLRGEIERALGDLD